MDLKRVEVTWIDAEDHKETWISQQDAEEFGEQETPAVSIGFLVKRTPKYVTIAGDQDLSNGNYGTVRKIPVSAIQKIEELEIKKATP